jgi:hypothetical protein
MEAVRSPEPLQLHSSASRADVIYAILYSFMLNQMQASGNATEALRNLCQIFGANIAIKSNKTRKPMKIKRFFVKRNASGRTA